MSNFFSIGLFILKFLPEIAKHRKNTNKYSY